MLDHVGLNVADFDRSLAFYEAALRPLGVAVEMQVTLEETGGAYQGAGLGRGGKPSLWIGAGGEGASGPIHVAVVSDDRASVDAFYAAAMTAGGRDNGPPGLRAHYHPNYYAAFVLDPEGNNVEAVCHKPA